MTKTDVLQVIAPDRTRHGAAVCDLVAKVFTIQNYYYGRAWCRDAYIGHSHYDWDASRIGLLAGEIVTHYGVWDYRMRIGTAVVRAGGIGAVATHGEQRKRGFMAKTAAVSMAAMRALGYDVSVLFGIDNFYDRYGYVRSWSETIYWVNTSDLPAEKPHTRPRAFAPRHRDDLAALYNRDNADVTGTAVKPTYQRCGMPQACEGVCWTGADGMAAGYLLYRRNGTMLQHVESAGDAVERLRVLGSLARRHGCQTVECFALPYADPLCRLLSQGNCRVEVRHRKNGGAMIALLNLPQLLGKIAGELTRRLQASPLAGWEGALRIDGPEQAAMLILAGGRVRVTPPADTPHVVHGGPALAQLLIGTDTPREIAATAPLRLSGDAALLLETLFPAQHPMLSNWDRF